MKKLGNFFLLLFTVCCLICIAINTQAASIASSSASGNQGAQLTWTLDNDGTLTISGTGDILESTFNDDHQKYLDSVEEVIIKKGITGIGDRAFKFFSNIKTVTMADSVTSIGNNAFECCYALTSVNFSNNLTYIGDYAFSLCGKLSSAIIPDRVTHIGYCAFESCRSLTSVVIGDGLNRIENRCFEDCSKLTSITFGKNVVTIGDSAFAYCKNLQTVTLPDGVQRIEAFAFDSCSKLTSVRIPNSICSIGKSAFIFCPNLQYTTYNNCMYLGNENNSYAALMQSTSKNIKSCTVHPKTKIIAAYAFEECKYLKSVTISKGLTHINTYAFSYCKHLYTLTLPDGVTVIEDYAFYDCSLKTLIIPDSITSIGEGAFDEVSGLQYNQYSNALYLGNAKNPYVVLIKCTDQTVKSCKIHAKTKVIYQEAFIRCQMLKSITIPNSVRQMGEYCFYACNSLTSVSLSNNLTHISRCAFGHCRKLISVTLPDSIKSIGKRAFDSCSELKSINFPDGITSIGDSAFDCCISLKSVELPNSLIHIGDSAFSTCYALSSVRIPDGVTSIGDYAFQYCDKLKYVTIPKSVKTIDTLAFAHCSSLKAVFFQGDVPSIDSDVFRDVKANAYYPVNNISWVNCRKGYDGDLTWIAHTPLKIKTQPKTACAESGKTVKATVKAAGDGLTYQWYVKEAGADKYVKSSVQTASYSCKITAKNSGRYVRCKITDQYGNSVWTKTVRLWMEELAVTTQPASKTVKAGATAKFTVKVNNANVTYQWQYRKSSTDSWKNTSATGNKTKTLSIPATVSRHGYQYRCKITDSAGNTIKTKIVTLYVLGIKTQPANKSVTAGTFTKFAVKATGNGLTYQWQYRTPSGSSWNNVSASTGKKATYGLTAQSRHNGYQYRCKVTDTSGNVIYTKIITLTVK